jgi:hypothetical protein
MPEYGAKRNARQHACAAVTEGRREFKDGRSGPAAKTSVTRGKHGSSAVTAALENAQGNNYADNERYGVHWAAKKLELI